MEGDVRGSAPQDRPSPPTLHGPAEARLHADRQARVAGLPKADAHAADETFDALLKRASDDPLILAFWLGGSRGMGRATPQSDYDCTVILADAAPDAVRRQIDGFRRPGVDLMVMSLGEFERYAAWGSSEAWDRYSYAHLKALIDKTGRVQPMIDEKGRVPAEHVRAFVHASLDHFLNQAYRALKCLRDGDAAAGRLEAAEGLAPFLDALFALHDGRLRPYYKYLAWELTRYPLALSPWPPDDILERLLAVLTPGAAPAIQRLLVESEAVFREAGFGAAFDGWGDALGWMKAWRTTAD